MFPLVFTSLTVWAELHWLYPCQRCISCWFLLD